MDQSKNLHPNKQTIKIVFIITLALLVSVIIVAGIFLVSTVADRRMNGDVTSAKNEARSDFAYVQQKLEDYYTIYGRYPATLSKVLPETEEWSSSVSGFRYSYAPRLGTRNKLQAGVLDDNYCEYKLLLYGSDFLGESDPSYVVDPYSTSLHGCAR